LVVALGPALSSADTSDVVPDGVDSYRVMLVAKTGFASSGSLQKKAYAQANEFCAAKSLLMETISMDSKRSRPLGGFPEATLRFRCVNENTDASVRVGTEGQPANRYTQLEQLKRLLDSGAITQQEYDSEKTKILGR
jgi:hypothetical protein